MRTAMCVLAGALACPVLVFAQPEAARPDSGPRAQPGEYKGPSLVVHRDVTRQSHDARVQVGDVQISAPWGTNRAVAARSA